MRKRFLILFLFSNTFLSCNDSYNSKYQKLIENYNTAEPCNLIISEQLPEQLYPALNYRPCLDTIILNVFNPKIKSIMIAKKAKYYLCNDTSSISPLIFPIKSPENQIALEKFLSISPEILRYNDHAHKTIYNFLSQKSPVTYQEKYNYLRILLKMADIEYYLSNNIGSLILLFQCLFFIENQNDPKLYSSFKIICIESISIYIFRETKRDEYKEVLSSFNKILPESYFNTWDGHLYKNYQLEGKDSSSLKRKEHLERSIELASTPNQKFVSNFNYAYYLENIEDKTFLKYYLNALDQVRNAECNEKLVQLYLYILSANILDEIKKEYAEKFIRFLDCSSYIKDLTYTIAPGYINLDLLFSKKEDQLDFLQKSRQTASKIWYGKGSLHLQDFYMENLAKTFDLFIQDQVVPTSLQQTIIDIGYDTRRRDLYRQSISTKLEYTEHRDAVKTQLNHKLLQINNFKKQLSYNSIIYKEMFDLYLISTKLNIKEYQKKEIDFRNLKEKLGKEDATLINIFRSDENYYMYYTDSINTKVYTFSSEVDSLINLGYNLIKDPTTPHFIENQILLEQLRNIKTKNVIFIPDGSFVNYPVDVLFPDDLNIFLYSNVERYLSSNDTFLDKDGFYLFSYTSEKSKADRNPKEYIELPLGLEECNKIINILNLEKQKLHSGELFTEESLKIGDVSVAHISSHAYSSLTNRYENFVLCRPQEKPQKLYGFELYETEYLPSVVILSACETGIGVNDYGAGVQTLSRAFLDNGTQTVIKTLWKVNEKATAEFMVEMYKFWVTGISLYEALEKTKDVFKTREQYSHPYYWAGFVLEGNPNIKLDLPESN